MKELNILSYQRTSTVVDGLTIVYTYSHETQNLPYRIEVKRVPRPNPEFGNFFNYQLTELNLGVEKTISQGIFTQALQYFGTDRDDLGQELFVGDEGFITSQEQMDRLMVFSDNNQEYKRFKIESAGLTVDEVDQPKWLEALLAEFCFFMAESLLQVYAAENR